MSKTVVGLYRDMDTAQNVVRELEDNGFRREDISLALQDERGKMRMDQATDMDTDVTEGAVGGAGVGAVLGGAAGLVVGLGALTIPGIGPILAAGPLATALAGAGVGAVAGGIIGALVDLGVPEEDAEAYTAGIRQGHVLVTISTPDEHAQHAADIMNRHNPIDVRREAANWRTTGAAVTGETVGMGREHREWDRGRREDEHTIPVVEEELQVGKRAEQRGVRVETEVTEEPVEERIRLREERLNVERRPVDRPASESDMDAFREGSFEVTETHETPVVQKEARVVEEVHLSKDVQDREETIRDTVRRTDVRTEDMSARGDGYDMEFGRYEPEFRRHFQTRYANTGYDYNDYRSAYLHGYTLHRESDCNGDCRWEDIEPEARSDWEQMHPNNLWEEFKDAVREGWDSLTHR